MKPSIPHRTRIAATLAVAGCSSSSSGDGNKTPSSNASSNALSKTQIFTTGFVGGDNNTGTPKQGGQLIAADYGEPRSLDPHGHLCQRRHRWQRDGGDLRRAGPLRLHEQVMGAGAG